MSVRSGDADSRENSPGHGASPEAKRTSKKRKVLSCFACRERKMKCDRVYPVCGRCQKTGRTNQCTYDPRLLEDLTGNHGIKADRHDPAVTLPDISVRGHTESAPSFETLQFRARVQERRIEELERKLAVKNEDNNKNPSHYRNTEPEEPTTEETMMFRGKGFRTHYHGSTSLMSGIAQFRELQAFTREALTVDHSIMRVKNDFKAFRDSKKTLAKQNGARTLGTDEEIFATLPDRSTVDLNIALYFQTWETAYRVLHEPSFWKEYTAFWEQRSAGDTSSSPGFAILLLLMITSTKCLTEKDDVFEGDTTLDRLMASKILDLCDAWIRRQPRKQLTLQFFQIQILFVFAKRLNCVNLKQDWVASGDLVRLAIASGMHRDPSLLLTGKISTFEKEMKKRLWVTIMELELQSSLEQGLQSSLVALYWDTPAPTNLPDDAFSAETKELPSSSPLEHFTSASYLTVSRRSISFRLQLMRILNDPGERLQYFEVLQYDAQINELLSSLPEWDDSRAMIPMALLQLQLQQFLLWLHVPFGKLAPKNARYMYSFTVCVDVASTIINTHNRLMTKGIIALNNMRNDVLRVALTLSQITYLNCDLHGPAKPSALLWGLKSTDSTDPQTHFADISSAKHSPEVVKISLAAIPQKSSLARILCTSAIDVVETATQLYEQKVMRMGTGYMEYWLLCVAIEMLPPSSSPKHFPTSITDITTPKDEIQARCRKSLDRFVTLALRVLDLQKDPENSFACSLRTTMASVSPSGVRTPKSVGASVIAQRSACEDDPQLMNSGAYSTMPSMDSNNIIEPPTKDTNEPFDILEDMQVDLSGWQFPDYWAFDLGGDF